MASESDDLSRTGIRFWPFKRSDGGPRPETGLSPNAAAAEPADQRPVVELERLIRERRPRKVLEIGTAQAVAGVSTHNMKIFPDTTRSDYTMLDIKPGADVDVVGDIHRMPPEWTDRFDACVADAVFEHLERPWIAAQEVARVLRPGGFCHIITHQTFPLHGYPSDFFRFSTDALALIFADAGMQVLAVGYQHRTKIILPPELLEREQLEKWNQDFPSYAVVKITATKAEAEA